MGSPLRHLAEVLTYAATRKGHDRVDQSIVAELAVPASDLGLPPEVELRWLGVAGFALTCAGTTLLIDPYVSRHTLGQFLRRTVLTSDPVLLDTHVPRADVILIGHTHFDHALDAPAIARRDGATVYGSSSAQHLMRLHGLRNQAVVVTPHQPFEVGPFTITFVPSEHSKLALGLAVPNGGELTCDHVTHLSPQAYCCGEVWGIHIEVGGVTLYHQGSANLLEDEIRHRNIDVFLCGIAGRQFTDDYVARITRTLEPATVVVTHHDDFFRPLGTPQGLAFGVDVERFIAEVDATGVGSRVVTLAPADKTPTATVAP